MSSAAIVLCGGRSTRMGRAKAWLPWRGRPMIAHVVDALRKGGEVDEVVVVSSAQLELPPLEATIAIDRQPALGPLAGLREGLAQMKSPVAYATSTDAPFLTARFVSAMLAQGDAAAPFVDGHVQTLAAVYPRRALPFAEALLAADKLRPLALLEAVDYRKVPAEELPDLESIRGFNTPDEYLAAVKEKEPNATAWVEFRGAAQRANAQGESEVPVGTLAEVLASVAGPPILEPGGPVGPNEPVEPMAPIARLADAYTVTLASGESIRDTRIPIGPGERLIVTDAMHRGSTQ